MTWRFSAVLAVVCFFGCQAVKVNPDYVRCHEHLCESVCLPAERVQFCRDWPDEPDCKKCGNGTVVDSVTADGGVGDAGSLSDSGRGDAGGSDAGTSDGGADACTKSTWYADADHDGLGDPAVSEKACTQPAGYVGNADDMYPSCGRKKAPANCTVASLRCAPGGAVGREGRETCIEDTVYPGCTDWVSASDCGADSPVCSGEGACGKCALNSDCSGFDDTKVCDDASGACVQCTGAKASECGGDVCDSLNRTCAVGVKPASADLCEACVSDAHCGKTTPSLCMPTSFNETDTGYACLPKRDLESGPQVSCATHQPYAGAAVDADAKPLRSVDGSTTPACKLRLTSCQGLRDFTAGTSCAGSADAASCGDASFDDGICAPVPADPGFQCSTACTTDRDCKIGSACTGAGYCSL